MGLGLENSTLEGGIRNGVQLKAASSAHMPFLQEAVIPLQAQRLYEHVILSKINRARHASP